ncbi:response regulator [Nucisporomicrobium flavum]|uniref:response regulator n=1 Tax=Nucisporomicrobium flavum TaxID=2785915 RepID=UPI003C2FA719
MAVVVVAEDDDALRAVAVRVLKRAGHVVHAAPDGAEALHLLREYEADVVVSDIDMPVMSGVELSQQIRTDPRTASLPVLLVSGSLIPGDDRPRRAEATAILHKPYQAVELISCLAKVLVDGHQPGQPPTQCP